MLHCLCLKCLMRTLFLCLSRQLELFKVIRLLRYKVPFLTSPDTLPRKFSFLHYNIYISSAAMCQKANQLGFNGGFFMPVFSPIKFCALLHVFSFS
ncbi:hypothetical protein BYT27DRAFT_6701532 [Phlegmacium glaucopus]|nr:hypothetical protein BYT27DRAFT_6701532 [Phlegmacium glaucopus]